MKHFLIALQFLTVFPVNIKDRIPEKKDYGKALFYFPLAGLVIGGVLAAAAGIFNFFPAVMRSALILITSVAVTGALHLDGFADTCDGLYGNRPKEERLRIMRDSHIGAMGAVGISCILLLKFSLMAAISEPLLYKALIVMAVFSRWAVSWACAASVCARQESKAGFFMEHARWKQILASGVFTVTACVLLLGLKAVLVMACTFICVYVFMRYAENKISGMTGDTLGAVNEIAEAGALFFVMLYFG